MSNWFYHQNGKSIGPIDEATMRAWVKAGSVSPSQLVRQEGSDEWQRADHFAEVWAATPPSITAERPAGSSQEPSKVRFGRWARIAGVIVAIIAAAVGREIGKSFGRSNSTPAVRSYPGPWATRDLGTLSLDAPFAFGPGQDVRGRFPEEVRVAIDSVEAFDGGSSTNPYASVTCFVYKPGTELSLDGAINGSMEGAIENMAAQTSEHIDTAFTSTATTIDGLPARRASYNCRLRDTAIQLDSACVRSGQRVWLIQSMHIGEPTSDSSRILDSIHIHPDRSLSTRPVAGGSNPGEATRRERR